MCQMCGAENVEEAVFCQSCGKGLAASAIWTHPGSMATRGGVDSRASQTVAVALILVGAWLLWEFTYAAYYGVSYDFDYWEGIDFVDWILTMALGLLVVILGVLSYPKGNTH